MEDYLFLHQQQNIGKMPCNPKNASSPSLHWQPLPPGKLKLNNRLWLDSLKSYLRCCRNLSYTLERRPPNTYDGKSDCQILIDVVIKGHSNNIHRHEFVTKINSLLSSLPQASIIYVPREANYVVHGLAKQSIGLEHEAILCFQQLFHFLASCIIGIYLNGYNFLSKTKREEMEKQITVVG
ncbi:hypothetical protein G4B88_002896 [Cannabis sativa]|uniref:RNase H type-1 domain-containing protein n=1 Tax=Cannabis sativa TaxID=3483 RepID=A0A7J6GFK3_CANSA|nr:hypothetical protein G4B88_002896 [Cannabis sativa]